LNSFLYRSLPRILNCSQFLTHDKLGKE